VGAIMSEDKGTEIVVVKGRGVVEIIEKIMKGFIKIETQGTTNDGTENKPVKVTMLIEREESETLFN